MELKDVLARIESRLEAVGLSAHAASMMAKKPDAIRNLRRAVQNGDRRGVTTETLRALAPVLKTTPSWLLEGTSPSDSAPLRVVGRIGAGAEIMPEFEQLAHDGLAEDGVHEIELSLPLPAESIAFTVEGDSLWPRYNAGDIVICDDNEHDPALIAGREAAVRTADGKRYLKTIRPGAHRGTFDLESHNAPPIRDVKIAWASPIRMIIPGGRWSNAFR
jgi:phage repressor protein C with HTH and peptisase S24 domain